MKREDLKAMGLTDEQVDSVMTEHGKALNAEKEKVTAAETLANDLQTQLTARDADITKLKESAGSNEDLKNQLSEWQTKYTADTEKLSKALADQKLDAALDREISKAKGRNGKAIKALINREALKLKDDGTVEGFDIEAIRTSDPYLFEISKTKDEGNEPRGAGSASGGVTQATFNAHINDVGWMQANLDAVTKGLADGTLKKG